MTALHTLDYVERNMIRLTFLISEDRKTYTIACKDKGIPLFTSHFNDREQAVAAYNNLCKHYDLTTDFT